jgi:DNA-directed RNA polymerase subunit L
MNKIGKISITNVKKDTTLGRTSLEYKISGDNINDAVISTIRRMIYERIPIFALDCFKFEKNNSVFHNTYIKRRLENLPVWGITNTVDFLENEVKLVQNTDNEMELINGMEDMNTGDDIELEVGKNLSSSTLKQFTLYVNYKNKTNSNISVTTDDAKFYFDEKQIHSPYKTPIPLVDLQPDQEVIFSAITNISTEETHTKYSAVTVNYYKMIKENEFDCCIESRGQITEKRIIDVAFINLKRQLKNFQKLISDETKFNLDKEQQHGVIVVNNEDHTLGNLISRGMQQHKNISIASYNVPHPKVRKVNFHFKLVKGNDIKKVLDDVVEYYIELYDEIKKQMDKAI